MKGNELFPRDHGLNKHGIKLDFQTHWNLVRYFTFS